MITRKSLDTLIREAAAAAGKTVTTSCNDRLMYSLDGAEPQTPGETAKALGVEWNLSVGLGFNVGRR